MIPLLRSRVSSRSSVLYGLRLRVQADFFLTSIALDFMYVCDAFSDGFLNPFVHFVFILIEPITAKDVATSKRWWCRSPRVFSNRWIVRALGIPPGSIENIEGVVDPLGAGLVMEATKVFDGCGAKSSPGRPGIFSLANPLIGVRHGIDYCRERLRFFVPISVILCHEAQGFKFHGQPSLPKSRFSAFSLRIAHSSVAPLVRCTDPIPVEPVCASGSLFSEVV